MVNEMDLTVGRSKVLSGKERPDSKRRLTLQQIATCPEFRDQPLSVRPAVVVPIVEFCCTVTDLPFPQKQSCGAGLEGEGVRDLSSKPFSSSTQPVQDPASVAETFHTLRMVAEDHIHESEFRLQDLREVFRWWDPPIDSLPET